MRLAVANAQATGSSTTSVAPLMASTLNRGLGNNQADEAKLAGLELFDEAQLRSMGYVVERIGDGVDAARESVAAD